MSALAAKFEWYLGRKPDIDAFRKYLDDVEHRLPAVMLQWATRNIREAITELSKDRFFSDLEVDGNPWATWWYKREYYNGKQGSYLHLYMPDGLEWVEDDSEDDAYIGFDVNYGRNLRPANFIKRNLNLKELPAEAIIEPKPEENGDLELCIFHLRHILTASKLGKSDEATLTFQQAIVAFTTTTFRAAELWHQIR
jgi:hypothetical protein